MLDISASKGYAHIKLLWEDRFRRVASRYPATPATPDPGCWSESWLRHFPEDSGDFEGHSPRRRRFALSSPAQDRTRGLGRFGMGSHGEQSQGQVLSPDGLRSKAIETR